MTTKNIPYALQGQHPRSSTGNFSGQSILLDRTKASIRGSTPDSEALASSDDELDQLHRLPSATSNPSQKSARRSSLFIEGQSTVVPKSHGGNGLFSPVSPGTAPLPVEPPSWNMGTMFSPSGSLPRAQSSGGSFTWGSNIWNTDAQKNQPHRLTDFLPSPTTVAPPGPPGHHVDESSLRSPQRSKDSISETTPIPFSIPLQPTPKTYRSQSYSAGQPDGDLSGGQPNIFSNQTAFPHTRRGASYAGIQHRISRPSLLTDQNHDSNQLGQLREVDDDEESSLTSGSGPQRWRDSSLTAETSSRSTGTQNEGENANQSLSSRNSHGLMQTPRRQASGQSYSQRLQAVAGDEAAFGFPETKETAFFNPKETHQPSRRFSEYGTRSGPHFAMGLTLERGLPDSTHGDQWHNSTGFGQRLDAPQSRRHSFADVPTRRNSFGSNGEDELRTGFGGSHVSLGENYEDSVRYIDPSKNATAEPEEGHELGRSNASPQARVDRQMLSTSNIHPTLSPAQVFNGPQHTSLQERPHQPLFIVSFKCLRADVFFIPEGIGLRIKKGDLVIVEADRGTDLGTVATDAIGWTQAKQLKEEFTKKHHEWLMAFSHHTQNGSIAGPNPNAPLPPTPHPNATLASGFQDVLSGELKPKIIKRLAQAHEITSLREKEGAEAKAKRICQQKVADHRLNMEILDAEYQMDWKKLTFFYFADAYINFNPLVTDLFKIYKTRIWMSAINTAAIASTHNINKSFVNPTRNIIEQPYDELLLSNYNRNEGHLSAQNPMQSYEGFYDASRQGMMVSGVPYDRYYPHGYGKQPYESRQSSVFPREYMAQQHPAVALPALGNLDGYRSSNLHHAASFNSQPDSNNGQPTEGRNWMRSFQDLSLGH